MNNVILSSDKQVIMKIVTSAQVAIFIITSLSDDNKIVILLFNNCFKVQFPLSPLVMIMTLFSKLQKFRENERNLLNKVIITTSCGNDDFI